MYSFNRLGSLEVVFWIPEGFSLDLCTWRFGSLECTLFSRLRSLEVVLGSLEVFHWILAPGASDPWSVFF